MPGRTATGFASHTGPGTSFTVRFYFNLEKEERKIAGSHQLCAHHEQHNSDPPDRPANEKVALLPPTMMFSIASVALLAASASAFTPSAFTGSKLTAVPRSTSSLDMKYKVAVVGGGPSGACAAEIFAQEKGIDTVLFERKLDNAKPCGGAIPLCMVGEFDLPETVVDRKVRRSYADGWIDWIGNTAVGCPRRISGWTGADCSCSSLGRFDSDARIFSLHVEKPFTMPSLGAPSLQTSNSVGVCRYRPSWSLIMTRISDLINNRFCF
jgi:threonine dehydrogenase-like Zn-dependent dehydrogenase